MEDNHINDKLSIELPYERRAFKVPKIHKPRDFIDILATRDQLVIGVISFLFIVNFCSL